MQGEIRSRRAGTRVTRLRSPSGFAKLARWSIVLFSEPSLAELYDRFCPRERRGDFSFYLPLVMAAEAVLDVGCGTGALLHRARESGHTGRLCGLDPAVGMLDQARKRSDIEWILGDLASVGRGQRVRPDCDERPRIPGARRGRRAASPRSPRYGRRSPPTAASRLKPATRWSGRGERWTPANAAEVTDAAGAVVRMARKVRRTG